MVYYFITLFAYTYYVLDYTPSYYKSIMHNICVYVDMLGCYSLDEFNLLINDVTARSLPYYHNSITLFGRRNIMTIVRGVFWGYLLHGKCVTFDWSTMLRFQVKYSYAISDSFCFQCLSFYWYLGHNWLIWGQCLISGQPTLALHV